MIPLRDDVRSETRAYVTYTMVGACVLVFILQFMSELSNPSIEKSIVYNFGMIPAQVLHGQRLWTLITSMFLHGGFLHIIGNMLFLWIFGDNVEDAFGHWGYLGLYVLSGIFGSVLHALLAAGSQVPTIGASGAISGVLGAYLILYPRARVLTLVPIFFFIRIIHLPAFLLLGFWILLQVLYGCASAPGTTGVAYFAHIGGFGVGVVLALLIRNRMRRAPVWYDIS